MGDNRILTYIISHLRQKNKSETGNTEKKDGGQDVWGRYLVRLSSPFETFLKNSFIKLTTNEMRLQNASRRWGQERQNSTFFVRFDEKCSY